MNQSSGSTSPTAARLGGGDTKPTAVRADRHPSSEADFSLDDLLLPDEFAAAAPADGRASIFGDAAPLLDAGSDFLRDYQPAPAYGSNIFAGPLAGAGPDESVVSFDPAGGFSLEDSLGGQDHELPRQSSDQFLEELDQPFPHELPADASWDDDGAGDDVLSSHDLPAAGAGSTLFGSGVGPVAARCPEEAAPRPTATARAGRAPAEPAPRRRPRSWLGPVGGAVGGAAATALVFALAAPGPKPAPPPVVVAAAPAPAGIDPKELAEARAATEKLRQESLRALKAEKRLVLSAGQARDESARQLAAEQARVRRAADAAQAADAGRAKAEAELARLGAELTEFKTSRADDAGRLARARAESAASRAAAEAAGRELARAKAAAEAAEQRLAAQVAARAALEAKLAEAVKTRELAAPVEPRPVAAAVEADPALAGELMAAGLDQYSAGRFADAERTLSVAVARGADARAWYFLGFARFHLGQDPTAAFRGGVESERRGRPHTRDVTPVLEGVDRAARAALGAVR